MPFEKKGEFYYSPSGHKYTKKQVIAYYATSGFKKRLKSKRNPKDDGDHEYR